MKSDNAPPEAESPIKLLVKNSYKGLILNPEKMTEKTLKEQVHVIERNKSIKQMLRAKKAAKH